VAQQAFLILFIDTSTRQVVRSLVASAFPVAQATPPGQVVQICAIKFTADSFGTAHKRLEALIETPTWKWLKPLMGT